MTDINFNCIHCNQNLEAPAEMAGDSLDCPTCGALIQVPATSREKTPLSGTAMTEAVRGEAKSPKSRTAATLCCFFLGTLGVHSFYVGRIGKGIAQFFTIGGLGVWTLVDFIRLLTGSFQDKEGRPVLAW